MTQLEDQLTELYQKEEQLQKERKQIKEKINDLSKSQTIKCSACEDSHKIGDLTAIQTHWYVAPSGCTEGDYWNEGELQFICPKSGTINRLLFDKYDVPYNERSAANDPEIQFKRKYAPLFKEVRPSYDKNAGEWVNNFYVDRNRKMFGLVEKRVKQAR